jgi:hypothetical protein
MEMEMIVFPDGRVALCISLSVNKRVVDSVSGNPRVEIELELFDNMAAQINDPNGEVRSYDISKMSDFTMTPGNFEDIENWMIKWYSGFVNCRRVQ